MVMLVLTGTDDTFKGLDFMQVEIHFHNGIHVSQFGSSST